jgi:hypothetical protein
MLDAALLAILATLAPPAPAPSACDLLTPDEVKSVQGAPVVESKKTRGSARTDACFFRAEPFSSSVSLEVTRGAHDELEKLLEKVAEPAGGEREEERQTRAAPEPVAGAGQRALWLATPGSGTLLVLSDGSLLRLSAGGQEATAERPGKKERAIELAKKALARLGGGQPKAAAPPKP